MRTHKYTLQYCVRVVIWIVQQLASYKIEMDLFPDSDSDTDGTANPDYDGDLETIEAASDTSDSDSKQGSAQATVQSKPREKKERQKQMSKAERKRLMTHVRQVDISQLIVEAEQQLTKQLHFSVFEERGLFLKSLFLSHKSELCQLCTALVGDFCRIYESCAVGKEKCSRFQMQWHAHCSSFLIEPTSSEPGPSNLSVQLWNTLFRCD